MSELTIFLRKEGLGGVLDALEGIESKVVTNVQANPAEAQGATVAIDDAAEAVKNAFLAGVTKVFGADVSTLASGLVSPIVAAVETVASEVLGTAGTTAPPA